MGFGDLSPGVAMPSEAMMSAISEVGVTHLPVEWTGSVTYVSGSHHREMSNPYHADSLQCWVYKKQIHIYVFTQK